MTRIAALILACCGLHAPGAVAFDVASLFERLAKERPGEATFQEKKYMSLLDKPLESSGTLVFTPPHTLEKRTVTPRPERIVVDRERLRLERGGKAYSMALRDNPAVAVLVESIRGTLAGDLAALTKTYSVGLEGHEERWKLRLRPLDPSAASLVERIEITGSRAQVRSIEIHQTDGDRSVMSIAAKR